MIDYELRIGGARTAGGRLDNFLQLSGRQSQINYAENCFGGSISMSDISFDGFSYMSQDMTWRTNGEIDFQHDCEEPYVIFSVAMSGALNKWLGSDDIWREGDANLSYMQSSYHLRWGLVPGGRFRQAAVLMPLSFVRRMESRYPDVFGPMEEAMTRGDMRKAAPDNWRASRAETRMLDDVAASYVMGSAAGDYALQRILDCLSPSLYRMAGADCSFSLAVRDKMYDARDVVSRNLSCPMPIHELAAAVGTNECTLKKAFKREFGMTVFGYIYSERMRRAASLLKNGSMSMSDVAMSLGYDHLSHFSTAFRRFYGVPPSRFVAMRCR